MKQAEKVRVFSSSRLEKHPLGSPESTKAGLAGLATGAGAKEDPALEKA